MNPPSAVVIVDMMIEVAFVETNRGDLVFGHDAFGLEVNAEPRRPQRGTKKPSPSVRMVVGPGRELGFGCTKPRIIGPPWCFSPGCACALPMI